MTPQEQGIMLKKILIDLTHTVNSVCTLAQATQQSEDTPVEMRTKLNHDVALTRKVRRHADCELLLAAENDDDEAYQYWSEELKTATKQACDALIIRRQYETGLYYGRGML